MYISALTRLRVLPGIFCLPLLLPVLVPGKLLASETSTDSGSKGKVIIQKIHDDHILSAAISPDGKYIVTGSKDKTIKLWNRYGRLIRTFNEDDKVNYIRSVAFSPDGKSVISGSEAGGTVRLWDIGTGVKSKTLYSKFNYSSYTPVSSAAFSPDGQFALSGGDEGAQLWNLASGRLVRAFNPANAHVNSVAFSPNGKIILTTCSDNTLRLWDRKSGHVLKTFTGHKDEVLSAIFSPDGKFILSSSNDRSIKMWDRNSGKLLKSWEKHQEPVKTLALSKDGKIVISSDGSDTIAWDVKTGKTLKEFRGDTFAFDSRNSQIISFEWPSTFRQWNLNTGKEITFRTGTAVEKTPVNQLITTIAVNKNTLLTNGDEKDLYLWDITTGRAKYLQTDHSKKISAVALSHNGKLIATGSVDNTAKLLSTSGQLLYTLKSHSDAIRAIAFSPDDKLLVTGSDDGKVKLWNIESGALLNTFVYDFYIENHFDRLPAIRTLAFSPDGESILWGDRYGAVIHWNIKSGKLIDLVDNQPQPQMAVNEVMFQPLKQQSFLSNVFSKQPLIALSVDSLARVSINDLAAHKLLKQFYPNNHDDYSNIYSIATNSSGSLIITGHDDHTVRLYDTETSKIIRTFKGHNSRIKSVAFSPDEKFIISVDADRVLKIWNIKTGKSLLSMMALGNGEWVSMTPEGYFDTSANGAKFINILTGPLDTISIDQYYETFYRPDIVNFALKDNRVETKIDIADIKLAPVVEIIETVKETDKDQAQVTLRISKQNGGLGQIRLYSNDAAVSLDNTRALKLATNGNISYKKYTIKLVPGENHIRAIAFNEDNTMQSIDAMHTIFAKLSHTEKPALHALILGIKDFKNPRLQLKYSVADAELFKQTLESSSQGLFESIKVHFLTSGDETSKESIIAEFKKMQNLKPSDLFVFYVASHGTVDEGEYFLITSNVGSISNRKLKEDAISQNQLKQLIANIPTTKKFIVIDTCNAAALGDSIQAAMLTRGMSEDTAIKVLSRAVGSTILSASTSQQEALEGYKGHGLFTYILSEGLKGKADLNKDGFVKTTEIADYLDDEVPEIAEKVFKRAQYPTIAPSGNAFPITHLKD